MARRAALIAACALALMAGAFRFTAAPGPGLDPDAMSYLGAARTLVEIGSFRVPTAPWWSDSTTQPLSHFPPGYSAAIAVPVALGASAPLAARLVQSVAAGVTIIVLMLTLWPVAGAWGAVLGALLLALSPAFVFVHLSVLSEPLFLALVVLALWSMVRHPRASLAHGLIAAGATMVRYAGLSVAAAAALWALRDRSVGWRERGRRAALALAPSVLAMAAWSLSRARAPGHARPIRKFAVYGDWWPSLHQGASTVAHLLAPSLEWEPVPRLAAVATLAAVAAMTWSTVRASGEVLPAAADDDPRWPTQRELLGAAGCLALAYAGLVVASRAFADPAIPFDFRLGVPLVPLAVASIAVVAARAWRVVSRPARTFGVLALLAWGVLAVRANHQQLTDAMTDGGDFASSEWRDSPTLAWVRAQGPSRELFTNWPCAIWFHLDRRVRSLPETTDVATLRAFVARLRARNGAVVVWHIQSPETAQTDSLVARAGLVRVGSFDDGGVFEAPPSSGGTAGASGAPGAPRAPAGIMAPPPARR